MSILCRVSSQVNARSATLGIAADNSLLGAESSHGAAEPGAVAFGLLATLSAAVGLTRARGDARSCELPLPRLLLRLGEASV